MLFFYLFLMAVLIELSIVAWRWDKHKKEIQEIEFLKYCARVDEQAQELAKHFRSLGVSVQKAGEHLAVAFKKPINSLGDSESGKEGPTL